MSLSAGGSRVLKKKVFILIIGVVVTIVDGLAIWVFAKYSCGFGEAFAGALFAIFIEWVGRAFQDLSDTTDWKTSQRKLKRGGFIRDDTLIRISFAYLYRIKVGDKYMLVQNSRNTKKYQPVGGVYKLQDEEKNVLKNLFHVMDDNKIPIDESSRNDYRLRMENRYLRKFMNRFDSKKAKRERIDNVTREFKEELIDAGILDWDNISYRYCGRHITELKFGDHFQMYELLLADVVELLPTKEQERELRKLLPKYSPMYHFATAEQIICLGMDIESGNLQEWISDHSKKILQENEPQLMKTLGTGKVFSVNL